MVIALLCLAQVVVVLDVTIVAIALPALGSDLGLGTTGLSWVVNAYALTLGCGLLVGGRVADRVGHRRIFIAGILLFGIASLGGGLAPSAAALVAARVVQGVGAALVVPSGLALIVGLGGGAARSARALGWWTAAAAGGGASGWVLGGVLSGLVGWRWVFLVNVPVCIAVAVIGRRRLPTHSGASGDRRSLGLGLLKHREIRGANAVAAVLGAAVTASMFLCTLHAQGVLGMSAIEAGLLFPPFNLAVILGSWVGPRVLARWSGRATVVIGLLAVAAGGLALHAIAPDAPPLPSMLGGFLLLGLGSGMATVGSTAAGTARVDPGDTGLASGLLATSTQLGTALGLAGVAPIAAARTAALGGGVEATVAGYELGFALAAGLAAAAAGAVVLNGRAARTESRRAPRVTGREAVRCPTSGSTS
jgi:MFS family permease